MPTSVLRSQPGIKRDGTRFEGEYYTDGQWVRFQRGLPRKMGGYRVVNKFIPEPSRGFTTFTNQSLEYCHSGGAEQLTRFTLDQSVASSPLVDRTPLWVQATGTVELVSGTYGSVDSITVNGVNIMSGPESFDTSLEQTAENVANNINAFISSPNYTAEAVGTVITITSVEPGPEFNGFVVSTTHSNITTSTTNMSGGLIGIIDNEDNAWTFGYQYSPSDSVNYIIASVSPNGSSVDNSEGGQIFYGEALGIDRLINIPLPLGMNATGGVVILHPYLFYYGTDGMIGWSVPGDPTDLTGSGSGQARPWSQKIIKGMPLRAGAGNAPAGIFWAYDAVIRSSFVGGSPVFQFDVLATDTSIMSQNSVVDYDGIFYWAGVDRFMMFNGVVRELPNTMNLNWFLDNLKIENRAKVFAFKVPRYGEIWWCYPRGEASECTHAVIYNVRENTWYDTELPSGGRSAGQFSTLLASPILCSPELNSSSNYNVWLHEKGLNKIDGMSINPVVSFFQTADINSLVGGVDSSLRVTMIEPDFIQKGPMSVQVRGRQNARSQEVVSNTVTFPEEANLPHDQVVVMKEQRRQLTVRFTSDVVNGDYQMGQVIIHIETGDAKVLS